MLQMCCILQCFMFLLATTGKYASLAVTVTDPHNDTNHVGLSWSPTTAASVRLRPGQDLKEELLAIIARDGASAVSVVTCVGSLSHVRIRLAGFSAEYLTRGDHIFTNNQSKYEIVSLVGTLESKSPDTQQTKGENHKGIPASTTAEPTAAYGHLHISLADAEGRVIGGHLLSGNIVHTTAEVTLLKLHDLKYTRSPCALSGYDELLIVRVAAAAAADDADGDLSSASIHTGTVSTASTVNSATSSISRKMHGYVRRPSLLLQQLFRCTTSASVRVMQRLTGLVRFKLDKYKRYWASSSSSSGSANYNQPITN